MKNKKGIFFTGILVLLGLLLFYLILYIPIPAFARLRAVINYFLVLIFWILLQVLVIFGYFKLGSFAVKGFDFLKHKFTKWTIGINNYIVVHS